MKRKVMGLMLLLLAGASSFANTCERCSRTFWPNEGENGRLCQNCINQQNIRDGLGLLFELAEERKAEKEAAKARAAAEKQQAIQQRQEMLSRGNGKLRAATHWRFPNGVQLELILCPAGTVAKDDWWEISISEPFLIGKYEVTQAQFQAVMGTNPSHFRGDDLPVENLSKEDVILFFKRLNDWTEGQRPAGYVFALPNESQWAYAYYAGKYEVNLENIEEREWFNKNSEYKTHPVGQKEPNDWGIYDMLGNVHEFTASLDMSCFGEYTCIFRGGCFYSSTEELEESVGAGGCSPRCCKENTLGFRIALVPVQ